MHGSRLVTKKPAVATKSQRKQAAVEQECEIQSFKLPPLKVRTDSQKKLLSALKDSPLVIAVGPAGTGKSFIGAYAACQALAAGKVDRIVLSRNPLPTGTSLGFFAGSEKEKMMTWLGPIIGTFKKILKTKAGTDGYFDYLVNTDKIVYQPMEVIKGSTFDRTFVLIEESQELTMEQIKTISTRMGEESTLFFNGDAKQPNSRNKENGFQTFVDVVLDENVRSINLISAGESGWDTILMPVVAFETADIVRSDITRKVVTMFDRVKV